MDLVGGASPAQVISRHTIDWVIKKIKPLSESSSSRLHGSPLWVTAVARTRNPMGRTSVTAPHRIIATMPHRMIIAAMPHRTIVVVVPPFVTVTTIFLVSVGGGIVGSSRYVCGVYQLGMRGRRGCERGCEGYGRRRRRRLGFEVEERVNDSAGIYWEEECERIGVRVKGFESFFDTFNFVIS
ncbi:hypothetical protein LR48_Vigan01g278900 [Vigna angularis]|uniref:Uncharacterized protein n=1 Tax=Phaseolus angularis TaxID=3914 RepID=A0A0L9TRM5_PHAAN|nr:hypothetical protein LR48_Vigan01g278900 [Vigna angularis]